MVWTGGGFDPGELAPMLLRALAADVPLSPDPQGDALLRERLAQAAAPPPAQPVSLLPALAAQISGRDYRFAENELGVRSLGLVFASSEARVRLGLGDEVIEIPVGLDGVYRLGSTPIDGLPPGARGFWKGPDEFVLDLNLIGKIDRFLLSLNFRGDRLAVRVERPRGGTLELAGEASH